VFACGYVGGLCGVVVGGVVEGGREEEEKEVVK